ncbi:MAG: hypothetical protein QF375_05985 [Arenicellales bacterium]|nr:hypothetical protein [Arenicellales bacterium]
MLSDSGAKVVGGKPYYGEAIGVLLFDHRRYPMIPGEVGNACSYDFPVRMKIVPGLDDNPYPLIYGEDGELVPEVQIMVQAVKEMEAVSCGSIKGCLARPSRKG